MNCVCDHWKIQRIAAPRSGALAPGSMRGGADIRSAPSCCNLPYAGDPGCGSDNAARPQYLFGSTHVVHQSPQFVPLRLKRTANWALTIGSHHWIAENAEPKFDRLICHRP